MATTDIDLLQLLIWVGTTAQIEAAIQGGQIGQNDLVLTTDGPDYATTENTTFTIYRGE